MRLLVTMILTCLLVPAAAHARAPRMPHMAGALRAYAASTDYTIPAAWAGIWEDRDSVYVGCGVGELLNTDTSIDTLCAGDPAVLSDEFVPFLCNGTVTDNSVDITCSGSYMQDSCAVSIEIHLVATRNGNSSVAVSTVHTSFSPPGNCFDQPDQCSRNVTYGTRLGPAPAGCATPVQPTTWGNLKSFYR